MDEWTEERCIQLIREYRARPILWDPKDSFFFKKTMKPAYWEEISDILNIPADACKHKMIVLMSSFRREKAKIMHSIKGDGDTSQLYTSTWFGFKEMAFLMDKDTERKRQSGVLEVDDEVDETPSVKKVLLKHHFQPTMSNAKRKPRPTVDAKKRLARLCALQTLEPANPLPPSPALPPQRQLIPGPSVAEFDEEIRSFTNFIANKMKKYTETTKNAVQEAICEIIFRADHNQNIREGIFENAAVSNAGRDPLGRALQAEQEGTTIIKQDHSDSD